MLKVLLKGEDSNYFLKYSPVWLVACALNLRFNIFIMPSAFKISYCRFREYKRLTVSDTPYVCQIRLTIFGNITATARQLMIG